MKMLELPSYGKIPHSDEIRQSFLLKKIKPLLVHNPNCSAANSFRAIARKITGKETDVVKTEKKKGLFSGLFKSLGNMFKKKK